MTEYEQYDIEIPFGKTTGQVYTTCPKCSADRKKKKDKCLGVNLTTGIWHCVHCDWRGSIYKKQYVSPKWENKTDLPDNVLEWFQSRNITSETLLQMKITTATVFMPQVSASVGTICFNYFRDGQLVNIKYRDRNKNFRLVKDAEKIFYNLDGIKDQSEIWIVEGEIDCLTMIQAGFTNTCSVPNGANKANNNLDYLDSCWQYFEKCEKVYILTDKDEPGNMLADELARRIGLERSFRITLPEHKDINEVLCSGQRITREYLLSVSKAYPLLGVYSASAFWDDLINIRKYGFPKGWKPRAPFGNHVTIHPGYTSIITGIPGHGKSEHLDQLLIELGLDYDLKGAYFSPENWPTSIHIIKLVEKTAGKNFWDSSLDDINGVQGWINDHFFWTYPDDGFDIKNVLEHIRKAVLRHGINWYVIDPWNKLDHQYTGPETKYISECLDILSNFNRKNNIHGFIIAHPTKMDKDNEGNYNVPNLYSISGSAHFFNKADLGWTVYKKGQGLTDVHIQKVKFKYWGEVGLINYVWDDVNGRYYTTNPDRTNWLIPKENRLINFNEPTNGNDDSELPF